MTLNVTSKKVIEIIDRLEAENDALKKENAALRELVEMLYECPMAPECEECKRLNGGEYACTYAMRELGILGQTE